VPEDTFYIDYSDVKKYLELCQQTREYQNSFTFTTFINVFCSCLIIIPVHMIYQMVFVWLTFSLYNLQSIRDGPWPNKNIVCVVT
jgi:NAD-dependent oxidoreductase involved in siderophore biosynthesis